MTSARVLFPLAALAMGPFGLGSISACTSTVDVHSMAAPNVQLDRYRAFTFETTTAAPDLYGASSQTPEARDQIQDKAAEILASRGYISASAREADFVVRVEAGRREHTATAKLLPPDPAQTEYSGWLDNEDQDLVEGAFVIDVFDSRTKRLLWHGSAHAAIDPGPIDHKKLQHAVENAMASFPPHASRGP